MKKHFHNFPFQWENSTIWTRSTEISSIIHETFQSQRKMEILWIKIWKWKIVSRNENFMKGARKNINFNIFKSDILNCFNPIGDEIHWNRTWKFLSSTFLTMEEFFFLLVCFEDDLMRHSRFQLKKKIFEQFSLLIFLHTAQ